MSDNPSMPLRELASRAGVSVSTARDVRMRLESGRDAIPERFRSGGFRSKRIAVRGQRTAGATGTEQSLLANRLRCIRQRVAIPGNRSLQVYLALACSWSV